MQTLKYASIGGLSLTLSLLFGFISRLIPEIGMLHLIAVAAIVVGFSIGGVNAATNAPYYQRQPVCLAFALRAIVSIMAYLVVMLVGAWLYVGPVVEDLGI